MGEILNPLLGALATAIGGTLVAWLLARVRSGRLARTLEQAQKLIDLVEKYCAAYDGLAKINDANRANVEGLLTNVMQAVHQDFEAERNLLPEFERSSSSVHRALLLNLPGRGIAWLPFILFHTLVLFILYVVLIRAIYGGWQPYDIVALLVAGTCAALARLAVALIPAAR
jgi:hypothetical protein